MVRTSRHIECPYQKGDLTNGLAHPRMGLRPSSPGDLYIIESWTSSSTATPMDQPEKSVKRKAAMRWSGSELGRLPANCGSLYNRGKVARLPVILKEVYNPLYDVIYAE